MAWQAELTDKREEHGRIWIEITFTEDGVTHIRSHNLTNTDPKYVKSLLQAQVNQFDAVDVLEFPYPIGTVIDLTPDPVIPPPDPTPEEIAKAAWHADWRKLNQMLEVTAAIPALLTAQAQTQITALQTSLEADWLNSYLGDI